MSVAKPSAFPSIVRELQSLRDSGSSVYAVHYACENIFKNPSEPAKISAIAFGAAFSSATRIYSVMDRQDGGERFVLESYYSFLRDCPDARLLHWNMNAADFGFQAIANRFVRVLGSEPPLKHSDGLLIDLDEVLGMGYGRDFAEHPKLINIAKLNDFRTQYFLSGKEEADLFEKGDHARIRRSVSEKVAILGYLTKRLLDGTLETLHGGQRVEFAGTSIDSVAVAVSVGAKMLDVQRQLVKRHSGRPTIEVNDEYDAQDLYNSLLRVFFDDIRSEEWAPSYAGGATRIDFVLPRYKLAVELKHTRKTMTAKDVGDQLIIDITKYKAHQSVRHLVCLVFDPEGHLTNPRGIEADLSSPRDGLAVTVRIFDR